MGIFISDKQKKKPSEGGFKPPKPPLWVRYCTLSTYTHLHMHSYTHAHLCICTPITHAHLYTPTHSHLHTHLHAHTYIHTYTCTPTYTPTRAHLHTHLHVHTYIHTYTRTPMFEWDTSMCLNSWVLSRERYLLIHSMLLRYTPFRAPAQCSHVDPGPLSGPLYGSNSPNIWAARRIGTRPGESQAVCVVPYNEAGPAR